MDHINLFQTNAEFNAAYNGSSYVEPWVSFTMETSGLSFNKGQTPTHDYSQDYLTFEVISGGTISSLVDGVLLSKDNGENWDTEITDLTSGDKVIAKGNVHTFGDETAASFDFGDALVNVCGNIMSIYDSQNFRTITALNEGDRLALLFYDCAGLISAENLILPATTLADNCYARMFSNCISLTTAPVLPATTLAGGCYFGMFANCTSLTTAPELPVTTLAKSCYSNMFEGCTSLTKTPELPTTTLAQSCYYCMFSNCTSLTTAPELPATTLASYCYQTMFYGCTSLNYIKCLATDISASNCTSSWVSGVSSTGTFVKNPNMAGWTTGNNGIPANWTVQDAS